jgi:hypothetical protein
MKTGPSTYLYGQSDFEHWLDEFRAGLALARPDPRPGRDDIEEQLLDLVTGTKSREEVANWAAPWLHADWHDVPDQRLQRAIEHLVTADLKRGPSDYLLGEPTSERAARVSELTECAPAGGLHCPYSVRMAEAGLMA